MDVKRLVVSEFLNFDSEIPLNLGPAKVHSVMLYFQREVARQFVFSIPKLRNWIKEHHMILDANVLEKCLRHLDFLGLYSDISHEGCLGYIGYHLNLPLPSKDQSSDDHFTARRRLRRKRTRRRKRRRRRKRTKARRETRLEFPAGSVGGSRLSTWMSIPVGKWSGTIRNHRSWWTYGGSWPSWPSLPTGI